MLWALAQPVALLGLAGGFLVALGLRVIAQRVGARALLHPGASRAGIYGAAAPTAEVLRAMLPTPRADIDPIGAVSAVLTGAGWGRGMGAGPALCQRWRLACTVLAGPVAAIAAGQLALAAFASRYPGQRSLLALNRPSDVLHGVVTPTLAEQLVLSVAVSLECFGLLALLPIPPLDGSRLAYLLFTDGRCAPSRVADLAGSAVLLLLAAVPVAGRLSPLLVVLDMIGAPLLRMWT